MKAKKKKRIKTTGFWGKTTEERRRLKARYEEVSLDKLKPWKENPRFNKHAIPKIAEMILQHGFAGTIVATPDGVIRAGHTRYEAAKLLEMPKIWVHWKNFKSEDDAIAYSLSDNKSSEWSDWDYGKLSRVFAENNKRDIAKIQALSGFKQKEIDWHFDKQDALEKAEELTPEEREKEIFTIRVGGIKYKDAQTLVRKFQRIVDKLDLEYKVNLY